MRFFRRGQDNRVTGSYPSSLYAVRRVMHWHKRKQFMQKAHWIHGLGTGAWIWQGFCLSLCLEPHHTSASSSGLTGKIRDSAGELGDIWLTSLWFFRTIAVFHIKMCILEIFIQWRPPQSLEDFPVAWAVFDASARATKKPLRFCNSLSFFSPFISYWFSKREKKGYIGPTNKKISKNVCLLQSFLEFSAFSGSEIWNDPFIHFKRCLGMAKLIPCFSW